MIDHGYIVSKIVDNVKWFFTLYKKISLCHKKHREISVKIPINSLYTASSIDEQIIRALEKKDKTQSALIDAVKANLEV